MRILVVEDEQEISNFLKNGLEDECFVVDIAKDGEEGSFQARTNDYDLIILDNVLPKKTGKEVCKEIRQRKINTPIIILSVASEVLTKIEMLNMGADDYLTKPFSFEELLARIRALLRRPRPAKPEVLIADDLELDILKHSARRCGKLIKLTRKEFMLLEFLLRRQGDVLTRGMIMEHVWDINADPFSNTIETHIRSLRKKIDQPGRKKLIRTISGRGYKIEA